MPDSNLPTKRNLLRSFWKDFEWPLVLLLGLVSIVMGTIGFQRYFALIGAAYSLLDCFYQALQLFPLNSGSVAPIPGLALPWELQVSRLLAPMVTAYAFFQAVLLLFRDRYDLWRLRHEREHVVICGLGRKGLLLAQEFSRAGRVVVVVEIDRSNSNIENCREAGAIIVIGDGRDALVLEKAGIKKAKYLLSVCGDDGTNAEVAERARQLAQTRRVGKLICTIHIIDPQLWTLLREREVATQDENFRLEFFNVYDSGVRVLLRDYPPFSEMDNAGVLAPHLLIIGLGWFAESLIVHLAQNWCQIYKRNHLKLRLTVVDPDAGRKMETLQMRFPLVASICVIDPQPFDIQWPEFHKASFLSQAGTQTSISQIYICTDDSAIGISAGLALSQQVRSQKVQIMVRLYEDSGLANLLRDVRSAEGRYSNLRAFGLLERTCKPGLLDDGTHETLARAIHSTYLQDEIQKGRTHAQNASIVPWDQLSKELKESNRYQANDIGRKLNAIGYGITPWIDYGAEDFLFSADEIEQMACLEHERWLHEKMGLGWSYGQVRDDRKKNHPDLVEWESPLLDEKAREKDRQTVSRLPAYLMRAGFQIYKI